MKIETNEVNKAAELYSSDYFEKLRSLNDKPEFVVESKNNNFKEENRESNIPDDSKLKSDNTALDFANNADIKSEKTVKVLDRMLKFEVKDIENSEGEVEKKLIISVMDESTGEVIRTVPAEELKDEMNNVNKLVGIMLDKIG